MNPHNPFGSADFKSAASASFAIPAWNWSCIEDARAYLKLGHYLATPTERG